MPEQVGMQGGVPQGQESQNVDPFAPAGVTTTSIPQVDGNFVMGVPITETQPEVEKAPELSNDERRYQHWQSVADKSQATINQQQEQINQLARQNQEITQAMVQNFPRPQSQQEQLPTAPVAPVKPKQPSRYNREDALTDPKSESGIYLDELDTWREGMDNYNQSVLNYERERLAEEKQQLQYQVSSMQQSQTVSRQQQEAELMVQSQYGFNPQQARDFVQTYSDPRNITMDNLVQMYKIQNNQVAAPQQNLYQPSSGYQQVARNQQIAPPMGVMPSIEAASPANAGKAFMDAIIGGQKDSRKIFGNH